MRRPALALLLGCLLLVAGASALDGYDYYQTIEYAGCDQETYQQDIVIHRTTGTAYNETAGGLETWHIYVGEHCLDDYGDVRFTNSTGAELAYYLWPDYTNSSARFCVRLENATAAGTLVVHYGNASATTTSDGDATYLIFDHFETLRTSVWSVPEGSPSASGSTLSLPAASTILSQSSISWKNTRVEVWSNFSSDYRFYAGAETYYFKIDTPPGTTQYPLWRLGPTTITQKTPHPPVGQWCLWWINYGSTSAVAGWNSNTMITSGTAPPDSNKFIIRHWYQGTHLVDYALVRAYSATPPASTAFSGEYQTAAPPVTSFTANITAGLAPLTVQFTDTSLGSPTSWLWSFGDGNTSTVQDPVHTYTVPGTYSVNLTATNEYGSSYELKTDYITVYAPVTAQFTADVTSGAAPLTVQFTDLSTGGPTSWLWDFGDGNTSTDQNPQHTYSSAGTYTVTLTASHTYSNDTETKTSYISVVVLQPFPGCSNDPTDPDADGLYEDINGNGRWDFQDLVLFFQHLTWCNANQPITLFDWNSNFRCDFDDVHKLWLDGGMI